MVVRRVFCGVPPAPILYYSPQHGVTIEQVHGGVGDWATGGFGGGRKDD